MAISYSVLYRGDQAISYLATPIEPLDGPIAVNIQDGDFGYWSTIQGDTFTQIVQTGRTFVLMARLVYTRNLLVSQNAIRPEPATFLSISPAPVEATIYYGPDQTTINVDVLVFP